VRRGRRWRLRCRRGARIGIMRAASLVCRNQDASRLRAVDTHSAGFPGSLTPSRMQPWADKRAGSTYYVRTYAESANHHAITCIKYKLRPAPRRAAPHSRECADRLRHCLCPLIACKFIRAAYSLLRNIFATSMESQTVYTVVPKSKRSPERTPDWCFAASKETIDA